MLPLQEENRNKCLCSVSERKNNSTFCLLQRLTKHENRGQSIAFPAKEAMKTKQCVHKSKYSECCYFCSSDSRNTGVTFGQRLIVDWCESEVVGFLCWL